MSVFDHFVGLTFKGLTVIKAYLWLRQTSTMGLFLNVVNCWKLENIQKSVQVKPSPGNYRVYENVKKEWIYLPLCSMAGGTFFRPFDWWNVELEKTWWREYILSCWIAYISTDPSRTERENELKFLFSHFLWCFKRFYEGL